MTTERLDEFRRQAGRIAGKGGFALNIGDWYALHELARKIEALVCCTGDKYASPAGGENELGRTTGSCPRK